MAKGDKNDVKDTINQQSNSVQSNIDQLNNRNQGVSNQFQSLYTPAVATNLNNYGDVMSAYQNFLKQQPNSGGLLNSFITGASPNATGAVATGPAGPTAASVDNSLYAPTGDPHKDAILNLYKKYNVKPGESGSGLTDAKYWSEDALKNAGGDSAYVLGRLESDLQGTGPDKQPGGNNSSSFDMSALGPAISKFGQFADTGGFSPDDIANIRARAVAPIRSIADNARQQIQRQAAIRGSAYSPNTTAALAKVARDSEYAAGDTGVNAEAAIAGLRNQGMLAGASGLAGTGTNIRGQNLSAINTAQGSQIAGMGGMTGLYGTTPGLSNMFGNQVLGSNAQGINIGQLQQALMSAKTQGMLGMAGVPSTFQNVMGNIGQIGQLGANVATGFMV